MDYRIQADQIGGFQRTHFVRIAFFEYIVHFLRRSNLIHYDEGRFVHQQMG
ncbi:hypothetical protein D3C84_1016720 [compost metagenome]